MAETLHIPKKSPSLELLELAPGCFWEIITSELFGYSTFNVCVCMFYTLPEVWGVLYLFGQRSLDYSVTRGECLLCVRARTLE